MAELGERVANLEARLDAQSQDLADIRTSVRNLGTTMEARFTTVEARFATVETRFATLETRFSAIDTRFVHLETRMDNGFRDLRAEMHSNYRWIMGGIGGAIFTIILSMIVQVFTR